MQCDECRFWESEGAYPSEEEVLGECHRYPPNLEVIESDRNDCGLSCFHHSSEDDWCGEFQPIVKQTTTEEVSPAHYFRGFRINGQALARMMLRANIEKWSDLSSITEKQLFSSDRNIGKMRLTILKREMERRGIVPSPRLAAYFEERLSIQELKGTEPCAVKPVM